MEWVSYKFWILIIGIEYGMEQDMDMDMMEEYDQEGMMDMDNHQMMDEYDDEEQSINFDDNPEYQNMPPLDKMRKIRRAIMKTINDMREAHEVPGIYGDVMANKAATEYANYLLLNPEDPEKVTIINISHFWCAQSKICCLSTQVISDLFKHLKRALKRQWNWQLVYLNITIK